jgi:hypothetical protein
MGLWADTFGGGNSFTESVANTFSPNDGKEYQGGSLVDTNTNKVIAGGFMDNANTGQSNANVGSTSSNEGTTKTTGSAPGTLQKFTIHRHGRTACWLGQ